MRYDTIPTPVGDLRLTIDEAGALISVAFIADDTEPAVGAPDPAALSEAATQLRAYFAGERTDFDLPLASVGTEFQRRVWAELRNIEYGKTISYVELASRIGQPTASRAVGMANSRNPIAIVVPCHRVIGANGSLTGYAGGLHRKRWLLELESAGRALI